MLCSPWQRPVRRKTEKGNMERRVEGEKEEKGEREMEKDKKGKN